MAREITTDALPNQEVFDAPVIVPVTTIVMADCSTQTDSPAVGVKALNYSREMVQGERSYWCNSDSVYVVSCYCSASNAVSFEGCSCGSNASRSGFSRNLRAE